MKPSLGRIVLYRLSAENAAQIMRRRTTGEAIAGRIKRQVEATDGQSVPQWPLGAQAHIGTDVGIGDEFPMILVRVDETRVNGQVFLDGSDVLWVVSVPEGEGPGTWRWPPRA